MEKKNSGKAPEKKGRSAQEIYPEAFCVLGNIEWLSRRHGTTEDELARAMGCSRQTLRLRKEKPWDFRVDELTNIGRLWGLTPMQLMVEPVLPKIQLEAEET